LARRSRRHHGQPGGSHVSDSVDEFADRDHCRDSPSVNTRLSNTRLGNTRLGNCVGDSAGSGKCFPAWRDNQPSRYLLKALNQRGNRADQCRTDVGGPQRINEHPSHGSSTLSPPEPVGETRWRFPDPTNADEHGIVGVGADLSPATLVQAYRNGMFPMPIGAPGSEEIAWWSPRERGILEFGDLKVSRSLRQSCRRFEVMVNSDFDAVIEGCADAHRPGGWISPQISQAYRDLHELGWAHSIEVRRDGLLVGGLYGVQVAGLFAGESMFHTETDASKVALVALVAALKHLDAEFIDVQWQTDHLATLGTVTQTNYFNRLGDALLSKARSLGDGANPNWVMNCSSYLDLTGARPTGAVSPSFVEEA